MPGLELGPARLVPEGFSSRALETPSKSCEFLLICVLTFSRAAVSSDLWLAPSVSLIFYLSFCRRSTSVIPRGLRVRIQAGRRRRRPGHLPWRSSLCPSQGRLSGLHGDSPGRPCHRVGDVQGHTGPGVPGRFVYAVPPLAPSFSGALWELCPEPASEGQGGGSHCSPVRTGARGS